MIKGFAEINLGEWILVSFASYLSAISFLSTSLSAVEEGKWKPENQKKKVFTKSRTVVLK